MSLYAYPALYSLFVWWFSTGLIVLLDNLPRHTFRWSLIFGTAIAVLAIHRLHMGRADTSVSGAYAAFTYAVLVWGWNEMAFFMGLLTGPRRNACPAQCSGPRHFLHGVQACLYHELTIVVCAVLVVWASWGAPNQVGTWTFLSLWGMRQSAKLNVFLGVRNLGESFLPKHIAYLTSFMRRRAMNPLFPLSIAVGSYVVFLLCRRAALPGVTPFQAAAYSVVITMLALGVIEHWLLILPLPFDRLWVWWLRHTRPATPAKPVQVGLCDEQQAGAFPAAAAA